MGDSNPDCESNNPDDCKIWCYKGYPAEFKMVNIKKLDKNAIVNRKPINSQTATYTRKVITESAKVVEEIVPAEYTTVTREVLKEKGGLTSWKEVDCSLVEYQALPINWNLNSYVLTNQAKSIIDTKLMPVLANNPTAKLEIASHTDSRGTDECNQLLSERRAQAVVNYLQERGINSSLLVANGYGEKRLKKQMF